MYRPVATFKQITMLLIFCVELLLFRINSTNRLAVLVINYNLHVFVVLLIKTYEN